MKRNEYLVRVQGEAAGEPKAHLTSLLCVRRQPYRGCWTHVAPCSSKNFVTCTNLCSSTVSILDGYILLGIFLPLRRELSPVGYLHVAFLLSTIIVPVSHVLFLSANGRMQTPCSGAFVISKRAFASTPTSASHSTINRCNEPWVRNGRFASVKRGGTWCLHRRRR